MALQRSSSCRISSRPSGTACIGAAPAGQVSVHERLLEVKGARCLHTPTVVVRVKGSLLPGVSRVKLREVLRRQLGRRVMLDESVDHERQVRAVCDSACIRHRQLQAPGRGRCIGAVPREQQSAVHGRQCSCAAPACKWRCTHTRMIGVVRSQAATPWLGAHLLPTLYPGERVQPDVRVVVVALRVGQVRLGVIDHIQRRQKGLRAAAWASAPPPYRNGGM